MKLLELLDFHPLIEAPGSNTVSGNLCYYLYTDIDCNIFQKTEKNDVFN